MVERIADLGRQFAACAMLVCGVRIEIDGTH
jgi:hypothetical protein